MIYRRSGTTFTKLSDPATLPVAATWRSSWSPNGEYLAVPQASNSPNLYIYQKSGTTFTLIADKNNLPSFPTGGFGCLGTDWSPNGKYLAAVMDASPRLVIYEKSGNTFTKLPDPATIPTARCWGVAWTSNGEFLAVAQNSATRNLIVYQTGQTMPSSGVLRINGVIREGS
jgi:WD40 repeat protein